ncbi:hypothetical protein MKW98_006623 [Papaver atlanticum]|uniref:Uncharacterized protein n=1 Tax=Papaver atlanticum TaxID=357466 RepID=A0AAD4T748_9MAGN|nr:hypothetical protein MKW98_006623 [Papaver atlanticum]
MHFLWFVNWKKKIFALERGMDFWMLEYEGLDQLIRSPLRFPPNSLRFVASEIALNGGVFEPMYGILFFSYIGFASGKNLVEVKEGIMRDLILSMAVRAAFWKMLLYVNMFRADNPIHIFPTRSAYVSTRKCSLEKNHCTSLLTFEDQQLQKKPIKEC